MTDLPDDPNCVSKQPWGQVLSRSFKLFTFNFAREGGRSFGRALFYCIIGVLLLGVATVVIDSVTGWFSGWFDFWPFSAAPDPEPETKGLLNWGRADAPTPAEAEPTKWYCKWNPIC